MKHNLQDLLAEQSAPNKMIPITRDEFMKSLLTACYQCNKLVGYLFDDGRCKECTRLTPEEIRGD